MEDKAAQIFFNPTELRTLIPEFSGGSGVDRWLRIIYKCGHAYNWSDRTKLLYASWRMSGTAKVWYEAEGRTILTFADFEEKVQKAFPDLRNSAHVHMELQRVFKKVDESYEQYVHRVNAVGEAGIVSDRAIITYIIRGLSFDKVYPSLLIRKYRDIYELLQHLKWHDSNMELRHKQDPTISSVKEPIKAQPDGFLDSSEPVKLTEDAKMDNTKEDEKIESKATMKPGHSLIGDFNDKIISIVVANSAKGRILGIYSNHFIQTYVESKNVEGWVKDEEMAKTPEQIIEEINNLALTKIRDSGCYTNEFQKDLRSHDLWNVSAFAHVEELPEYNDEEDVYEESE